MSKHKAGARAPTNLHVRFLYSRPGDALAECWRDDEHVRRMLRDVSLVPHESSIAAISEWMTSACVGDILRLGGALLVAVGPVSSVKELLGEQMFRARIADTSDVRVNEPLAADVEDDEDNW